MLKIYLDTFLKEFSGKIVELKNLKTKKVSSWRFLTHFGILDHFLGNKTVVKIGLVFILFSFGPIFELDDFFENFV